MKSVRILLVSTYMVLSTSGYSQFSAGIVPIDLTLNNKLYNLTSGKIRYLGLFGEYKLKNFVFSGIVEINPYRIDTAFTVIQDRSSGGGSSPANHNVTRFSQNVKYSDAAVKLNAGYSFTRKNKQNPDQFSMITLGVQYLGIFAMGYKYSDGKKNVTQGNNSNMEHQYVETKNETTTIDNSLAEKRFVSCICPNVNFRIGLPKVYVNFSFSAGVLSRPKFGFNDEYINYDENAVDDYSGLSGMLYNEVSRGKTFYLSGAISIGYTFGKVATKKG